MALSEDRAGGEAPFYAVVRILRQRWWVIALCALGVEPALAASGFSSSFEAGDPQPAWTNTAERASGVTGPAPTGIYHAPSVALRADKQHFGASRRARWFGRTG